MITRCGNLLIDLAPIVWALTTLVFLGLSLTLLSQTNRTMLGVWLVRLFIAISTTSLFITVQTAYIAERRSADDIDSTIGWVIVVGTAIAPFFVAVAGAMTLIWQARLHRDTEEI